MKKLYYNIYSNITDRQYFAIEKKLNILQYKMSNILFPAGWQLPNPTTKKDGLFINFIKKGKIMKGSIGIVFEDNPNGITFTFVVSKYFDEDNYQYFLSVYLFENKEFSYFDDKITEFSDLALKKYNSWDKDTIFSLGEKDALV